MQICARKHPVRCFGTRLQRETIVSGLVTHTHTHRTTSHQPDEQQLANTKKTSDRRPLFPAASPSLLFSFPCLSLHLRFTSQSFLPERAERVSSCSRRMSLYHYHQRVPRCISSRDPARNINNFSHPPLENGRLA